MLKKIQKQFNVNEAEALLIYTAYKTNTCNLLKIPDVHYLTSKLDTEPEGRELYDKYVELLEEEGVNNRSLKALNGYVTISYSKTLNSLLSHYVNIFGMDKVVEATVNCYRELYRRQIKTPTILTFFKNEKGNGIDYYLEEEE